MENNTTVSLVETKQEDGYEPDLVWRFPEVHVSSGVKWIPWHSWTPGETTHVDGMIVFPNGKDITLDVAAAGDEYVDSESVAASIEAWDDGRVLFVGAPDENHVDTLVIGADTLTEDNLPEAIRRFLERV